MLLDLLEGLAKDRLLSLMIDLATVSEGHGFSTTHANVCSRAIVHVLDLLIQKRVLD